MGDTSLHLLRDIDLLCMWDALLIIPLRIEQRRHLRYPIHSINDLVSFLSFTFLDLLIEEVLYRVCYQMFEGEGAQVLYI
jgi:hypothetical protein